MRISTRNIRGLCLALAVSAGTLNGVFRAVADEAADRLALAVDTLTRLEGIDLQSNPAMKERILQVLARTRGTANFVRLVRHFSLSDQEAGLLEVAAALPRDEQGVEALRMVLNSGRAQALALALARRDAPARSLVEALGNSGHREAAKLLLPLVTNSTDASSRELSEQVVHSLARSQDGARELLALAKANRMSDPLRVVALNELAQVRWENIKTDAMALRGVSPTNWPTVPQLVQMTGDAGRGREIFFRASPGCFNCHVVRGRGTDLGPNLSEIGSKLAKEALYQAILEPSAGISFGYEAFALTLKDGDEVYGLIASETPTEIAIKSVGGVVARYRKSEIVSRQKSALSIMPAGLETALTPQQLADLVEFLAALKKAE